MDPINQNSFPNTSPDMPPQRALGGTGVFVVVILALALIIIGAIYFWRARAQNEIDSTSQGPEESQIQNSDDTASIEADLNATDVDNVDYDLNEANFTAS